MTRLIAFYQDTELTNGEYAAHAKRLRAECKTFGQSATIVKRDFGHDYLSITRGKPQFMLEQLDKHDEDLVYVDVDGTILKAWDNPSTETIGWAVKKTGRPFGHVHFLPNTVATREFLAAWIATAENWEGGDHSAMWLTIKQTGYEWSPLVDADSFIRVGLSANESTKQARTHLNKIGWLDTIRQRLAE